MVHIKKIFKKNKQILTLNHLISGLKYFKKVVRLAGPLLNLFLCVIFQQCKPKATGNQWKDDILEMSFLKAPIIALFLRLQIKGFIIGVTTVYITDTTALFLEE